LLDNKIQKV